MMAIDSGKEYIFTAAVVFGPVYESVSLMSHHSPYLLPASLRVLCVAEISY